jgi:hypothetical protein
MTALYHPRTERWPQVSLRGFFVLVTVLGVFLGWLAVQVKWIRDREKAFHDSPGATRLCGFEGSIAPVGIRLLAGC